MVDLIVDDKLRYSGPKCSTRASADAGLRHLRACTGIAIVAFAVLLTLGACGKDIGGPPTETANRLAEVDAALQQDRSGPFSPLPALEKSTDPKVALGRRLFNDPRLSRDDSLSCASCHDVQSGGDDGLRTAIGIQGAVGPVNTPTVLNARYNFAQFWDGRAATLSDQVPGPVHNPLEMDTDWASVIAKLQADPAFVADFRDQYPDGFNSKNIVDAIVRYEKTLVTHNSRFDRFLRGDEAAISREEKRGLGLFIELGCASCHQGRNIGGNMFQRFGVMGSYFEDRGSVTEADLGRYNVTGREQDRFVFRVPSLRNVELTAPYFHDGSVQSLEAAIGIMARYQLGRPISTDQIDSIAAFLRTLTGEVEDSAT